MLVATSLTIRSTRWLASAAAIHARAQAHFASLLGSAAFQHLQKIVASRFLLLWLLLAIGIAIAGYFFGTLIKQSLRASAASGAPIHEANLAPQAGPIDILAGIAFLLFLCFYLFITFHKEDFAYYDDDVMTEYSLQGVNYAPPIWPEIGRFFPLADQEFNALRHVTRSPMGYHALDAVELGVLLVVLFFVLEKSRLRYRFLVMAAAMLGPSLLIPFTGFVYPERNVLLWLAVMVLCLQRYAKTNAAVYFVGCLLAVHCALYYKETVVLLVVAYAVVRILLQYDGSRRENNRSWLQLARENALSIGILAVSSIYVLLFLLEMLPHHSSSYIAEHSEPLRDVVIAYLHFDWLPLLMLPILAVRVLRFLAGGERLDPLWDSLGVGAAAYYFTILALRLNAGNYMAPVDLLALLYLANIVSRWLLKPTQLRVAFAAIAISVLMIHDAAYSTFRMVERKETISAKVELAAFLNSYLPTVKKDSVEVFFPYASSFHLMGVADYLEYKGFRVAGRNAAGSNSEPLLVFEGTGLYPQNHCVDYRNFSCIHEDQAGTSALIVILPDDHASAEDVQKLVGNSKILLELDAPGFCTKQTSWFRSLHAISSEFSATPLPDRWLSLDVFQKPANASVSQNHL